MPTSHACLTSTAIGSCMTELCLCQNRRLGHAGQTASTESLQDTLALETITGVSSTSYWNANLSEFANAEPAPLLNGTDGNRSSIEAGQVTVSGQPPSAWPVDSVLLEHGLLAQSGSGGGAAHLASTRLVQAAHPPTC